MHVADAMSHVGDTPINVDILHKLVPVIKMEMKSDSDDSDDDEKYHTGGGQILYPVNNASYDAGMDTDIMDLVNKDLRDDEPDAKIPKLDESAYSNMDGSMCFDRSDSDEGEMKFSEPYENGSSMYAGDLKQTDNHVPCPIPPTANKKYPQRRCKGCRGYGIKRDVRYYCKACPDTPALCKPCFREYHL